MNMNAAIAIYQRFISLPQYPSFQFMALVCLRQLQFMFMSWDQYLTLESLDEKLVPSFTNHTGSRLSNLVPLVP
jgi:hypothetical protein